MIMKPIDKFGLKCIHLGDYGYHISQQDGKPYYCQLGNIGGDCDEPCSMEDFWVCEGRKMVNANKCCPFIKGE